MIIFLGVLVASITSIPVDHPDRVISLPGAPSEPNFPLYSGFLDVTDNGTQHKIFYVLCEAIRSDPLVSPLIVWFNGGPGSSSLLGFLLENGPYQIDGETRQLMYNDFSWNQYANVLYIESPSGVGFSHSNRSETEMIDDVLTGRVNRKALQDFMTRVHPRYSNRDFYLTGESYAGAYIPYLTREILSNQETGEFTNANFRGIAMGNAAVDDFSNRVAAAMQLYSLGMIPEKYGKALFALWERILAGERLGDEEYEIAYFARVFPSKASYDLPLECNKDEDEKLWHISKQRHNVECEMENLTETYLNRDDVQRALHVRTSERPTIRWRVSNQKLYNYFTQDIDTIPVYKDIIGKAPAGFRTLFYTGDIDIICPPLQVAFGARRIAEQNGMHVVRFAPSDWKYLGDLGGARTIYSTGAGGIIMDVITVRGAGHLVPINLPDRAFQIINNFIATDPTEPVDYSKMIPRR